MRGVKSHGGPTTHKCDPGGRWIKTTYSPTHLPLTPPCTYNATAILSSSSRLQAVAAPVAPVQASTNTAQVSSSPQAAQPTGDGMGGAQPIRLTIPERARTVTYVATAATLGTFSETEAMPFGSYVDYILDDKVCTWVVCG